MSARTRKPVLAWAVVLLACGISAPAWAVASGTISSDPCHLVITPGNTASTTITWSTSGCQTAQVYVSMDGGEEALMSQGASGSSNPGWIQCEKVYVFLLYEGTAHTNLLAWTSVTSHRPPDSMLGFNYWPADESCYILTDTNWTTAMKNEVEADLDHMSSLTGGVLRLFFWPNHSGYTLDGLGQGGTVGSDHTEICDNLPELLEMCADRDIRVIIAFGSIYLLGDIGQQHWTWWQWAYGTDGWNDFINDSETWMEGIVDAAEGSDYAATVMFYDYANEAYNGTLNVWTYVNHMYDNTGVPRGKRGLSVLYASSDAAYAKSNLGGRRLDYADYHCYLPDGPNTDIEDCYDDVKDEFPDSTVLIGEFGRSGGASEPSKEADQQTKELDVAERVDVKGIPFYVHWMFWDNAPPSAEQVYGWGYDHDTAKHVMGGMSDLLNLAGNPDMEDLDGTEPDQWNCGATQGVNPVLTCPGYYAGASSNYRWARITVDDEIGTIWLTTGSTIEVTGGNTLYVNSYVESNMKNVKMSVTEYDSSMTRISDTYGTAFTPSQWRWYNYLAQTGAWSVTLNANTKYVIVGIVAETQSGTTYLDVDTVSVWER